VAAIARPVARIFGRELRAYFYSPVAYIVIVIFLVVTGWFFFSVFFLAGRADLRDFFNLLPLVLSLVVPALTMRLFAEERSSGSYEILFTLPLGSTEILVGKFLAALCFAAAMLLPTLAYPITIAGLGELDWGPVVGGYLAALFLAALYCSVGLFASSLSRNQIVAFIVGLAICFALTLLDRILPLLPNAVTGVFGFLAANAHFSNSARGILDSRDLLYFASGTFFFLHITHRLITERES
jgi:ABC-2 type transport system permease protein